MLISESFFINHTTDSNFNYYLCSDKININNLNICIMTKENLNELKNLVSRFNSDNYEQQTSYCVVDICQYRKGDYSLTLQFELMFSLDVAELMHWCFDSNVSVRISQSRGFCYMDFQ